MFVKCINPNNFHTLPTLVLGLLLSEKYGFKVRKEATAYHPLLFMRYKSNTTLMGIMVKNTTYCLKIKYYKIFLLKQDSTIICYLNKCINSW